MKQMIFFGLLIGTFLLGMIVQEKTRRFTKDDIAAAEKIIGLTFDDAKRDSMWDDLHDQLANYESLRTVALANSVLPSIQFHPFPDGWTPPSGKSQFRMTELQSVPMPENIDALAFYSVKELAWLIKHRKVTSVQLTEMYLNRLKKYGPRLECVITLTEQRALERARRADEEIAKGKYRGPLHGIPYGAKDLLAVKEYKTTWGAMPYKDQTLDVDATVIQKLDEAGAVLVAKLTMGALAWGDVWYGGKTRNPWNIDQGSSGSSAGSASATAAGLVAFAIGTETWGSIVSPSTRCGLSGLRPTYGRVSRHGAMALSWSMDKIGPMCRSVEDCAIVFRAMAGTDPKDPTVYDFPFDYDDRTDWKKLRIGYLASEFEKDSAHTSYHKAALDWFRAQGVTLIPLDLPTLPFNDIAFILSAEAAAAFDDLTRSGRDALLVRQIKNAWPNVFRSARFIPAVEYIQANRIRHLVINDMADRLKNVDVYLSPSFSDNLLLTNLTGHPCVVLPNGFTPEGQPTSITVIGKLFGEADVLRVAKAYQEATGFHKKHPDVKL